MTKSKTRWGVDGGWRKGDVHVLPDIGFRKHKKSRDCKCKPVIEVNEPGCALVLHHDNQGAVAPANDPNRQFAFMMVWPELEKETQ